MNELIKKTFTPEFIRFLIVGVISAGIEYALLFLFAMKMDYKVANIPAFILTNVITFILSNRYVFTSTTRGNKRYELTLFVICLGGALAVNSAVLFLMKEVIVMDLSFAKAIAIAVTVIWNFVTRKHIVFRNREVAAEPAPATREESED